MTRAGTAIMCVTMMNYIEFADGSIDGLVRYSRIRCTQVLSHESPMVSPPTLLILTFRQVWVDDDVLWEKMAIRSCWEEMNCCSNSEYCASPVSLHCGVCRIHNGGLGPA